jgi:Flp pilus assembly protein TadG
MRNRQPQHGSRYQRGAVAVEFALVIVVLLLIVSGIVEFGRVFWYYDALTKATRDGARLVSLANRGLLGDEAGSNTTNNPVTALSIVRNEANAARLLTPLVDGKIEVRCIYATGSWVACDNRGPTDTVPVHVRVKISGYSVQLGEWLPFVGAGNLPLEPYTVMRYMDEK